MIKTRCCGKEVVAFRCPKCGRWIGRGACFTYDTEKESKPINIEGLTDMLDKLGKRGK